MVKIALVDDHVLLRNALARLIAGFDTCEVILEVANGKEETFFIIHDHLHNGICK